MILAAVVESRTSSILYSETKRDGEALDDLWFLTF